MVFSEKLGVLRLDETYVTSDPISPRDERRIEKHIEESIAPHVGKIRAAGFERVVGTSGTILALGQLATSTRAGHAPRRCTT